MLHKVPLLIIVSMINFEIKIVCLKLSVKVTNVGMQRTNHDREFCCTVDAVDDAKG